MLLFIVIAIFLLLTIYVIKFPQSEYQDKIKQFNQHERSESWEDYQYLKQFNSEQTDQKFQQLEESSIYSLHRKFLSKIQKCLSISLTHEEETQLIYNLSQGSTREAILRGLISKEEVNELIELSQTPLVSKDTALLVTELNKKFLQRDDFELPLDMRQFELKIVLMEEFLDVGEAQMQIDMRRFYLWAGYILRNYLKMFDLGLNNEELFLKIKNIPKDHLLAEVPLAICNALDTIQNQ